MAKTTRRAGHWIPVLALMILSPPAVAHNGAVALAWPIDNITIDGNLDDWPEDMRTYPITCVEYGDPIKDTADFEGAFRIGYNTTENALYVAVEVRDESTATEWSWRETDGCNVYVDSQHLKEDSLANQLITYGQHYRVTRVSKQAVTWEWKHQDGIYRYEWCLKLGEMGGQGTRLKSGTTLGWDLAICDKDNDGSFSWVSWGRGADKGASEERCGDVVLMASGQSTGWLQGRLTRQNGSRETMQQNVLIQSLDTEGLWVRAKTNRDGAYRIELPEGRFQAKVGQHRRKSATKIVEIKDGEQAQLDLEVLGTRGLSIRAGTGASVEAIASRLGNGLHLIRPYGLARLIVWGIAQSRHGYLWLATNQGLARYNGEVFTFFTTKDGLLESRIDTLIVDRSGRLWMGSPRGLSVHRGNTFTHFTTEDGLIGNQVKALLEDRSGRLWIGTSRGVSLYDGKAFTHFTTEDGLKHNDIMALVEDSSGRIWIGTSFAGVSIYDGGRFTNLDTEDGLVSHRSRALLEDSSGRIWIGTQDGGISLCDDSGFTHYTAKEGLSSSNEASALLEDRTGRIWIGNTEGARVFEKGTFTEIAAEEPAFQGGVKTFLEDQDGTLWWGTDNGLIRHDSAMVQPVAADTLSGPDVSTLLEDSAGRIWLGGSSGVSVYDGSTITCLTEEEGLARNSVMSLLEDRSGRIWVGTRGRAVSIYDDDAGFTSLDAEYGHTDLYVRTLLEDRSDQVWIGTNEGVGVYNGKAWRHFTMEDGLVCSDVKALLEDRTGRIWMGTTCGVTVYDGARFSSITEKDGLVGDHVTCLLEDRSGRLWMGTMGAGVSIYDRERFHNITREQGLVSNNVNALLEDRTGQVWIGTDGGGVSRYDGKSLQSLTHGDGLPSNNVAALMEDASGHIWIGTQAGVVRYLPSHAPPSVSLVDVVTNRRHGPVDEIRLPSTRSLLAFEYRSLSLKTRPGAMVYRYRLKGVDPQWQRTHNRRVEYRDVPRGNYTFEVQAVDRDLSYSENPIQVAVTVHPPYGLLALCISATVGVVLGLWQIRHVRQRGARLRNARDELERRVEQRTSELSESNTLLTEEIAERKRVEVALLASEQRFRRFFENEPEYCYMVSPRATILEVNGAALSALGYAREDLVRSPLTSIYAPECHPRMRELVKHIEESDEVRDEEMTLLTKCGDRRTVLLSASRVSDETGETLYYVSVQRDITEQRRLEAQEREYQKQLTHVSRLTVAGELASGIAHELNQPLGAIATFSDGCRRLIDSGEADTTDLQNALVNISTQAQRGGEIIRRMRRFVSKHEIEYQVNDLNDIVLEASRFAQFSDTHGIPLCLDLAEEPLRVRVDRIQIQQVIINLVQNGLDAMRKNNQTECPLTIRTARSSPTHVQVVVIDRGVGLPDNDVEDIFKPFVSTKVDGLGIGLSISRSIVEAHQGRIWAAQNPDQGMTFGFELPANEPTKLEQQSEYAT